MQSFSGKRPSDDSAITASVRAKSTRILWASRHFWPCGAGRHARAAATVALTNRLSEAGYHIEVVTPRYSSHWSDGFQYGNIDVHRIATAPRGEWSVQRYVRYLSQWMSDQADRFDVFICDGLNDDARAIASAISKQSLSASNSSMISVSGQGTLSGQSTLPEQATPSEQGRAGPLGMALCDGWGADADEVECRQSRSGRRTLAAVAKLDYVVTRHAGADRYLIGQGIQEERIRRISNGFPRPIPVASDERVASRHSLGLANTDLVTDVDDRVLLWCGHMKGRPRDHAGVMNLVANARLMCGRYPNLRIWLLGDGELRDWVHTELKAEGVRSVVAIPGTFADMTDVWRAVDFAVITDEDQLRYTLPTAIARGIPVLLNDLPTVRSWVGEHFQPEVTESFAWYDQRRAASLRKTFRMLWDHVSDNIEHARQIALEASSRCSDHEEIRQWNSILPHRNTPQNTLRITPSDHAT